MSNVASAASASIISLLTAPAGADFALNAIAHGLGSQRALALTSVLEGNTSPDLFEKSIPVKYPTVNVYCDKVSNTLREKFRVFSGTALVVMEVRHSQDQVQQIQAALETYVTAACQILDGSRGDLGNGLFYAGGYEVSFGPVKRGGLNVIQTAKMTLELDVSV